MASTYSSILRLELIASGEQAGSWGTTTNTNLGTLIEASIAGTATHSTAGAGDTTLTTINGSADEARAHVLKFTGGLTGNHNVICPSVSKTYLVYNATTGAYTVTLKTATGSGVLIPQGAYMQVYCDGTNVVAVDTINGVKVAGTAGTVMTFPATTASVARTDAAQTFTGVQTFSSSPIIPNATTATQATAYGQAGSAGIAETHAAASKATPDNNDEIPLADSATSFSLKKLTWANLKATVAAAGASFPSGTRLAFNQTAAPTGWTKDTTAALNDTAMRIVTGTVGSGGSVAFSSAAYTPTLSIGTLAVAAHTLTTAEMPSHTHTSLVDSGGGFNKATSGVGVFGNGATTATGGDGGHSHGLTGVGTSSTITLGLKYNDFVICSKD